MKNKAKNKKGMNGFETAILVIILLMLVIIYIDVLAVSQKMSAATSVTNYMARTIERQGGMLNYVPNNFVTYGHGSYTTSKSAYNIILHNLERTFGEDSLGDAVDIKITLVQADPESKLQPDHGIEELEFNEDSCFGIYLAGGDGTFGEDSKGFISTNSLKYYKPYYIVQVTMRYNMWVIPAVLSNDTPIKDALGNGEKYALQKVFTRIVVPSYYIQEENYNSSDTDNDNFFVV